MGYSIDFRQRVLEFKQKHNLTFEETSQHFEISIRSLFRWGKRIEPCTTHEKHATKLDREKLKQDVERYPDDYQWERAQRLGVAQSTVHYALKQLKISHKKNLRSPQSR